VFVVVFFCGGVWCCFFCFCFFFFLFVFFFFWGGGGGGGGGGGIQLPCADSVLMDLIDGAGKDLIILPDKGSKNYCHIIVLNKL